MKIAIDARMIGWTGIGRYTRELLNNLQELDDDNDYLVLLQSKDFDSVQLKHKRFEKIKADYPPYSFGEQLGFAALLYRLRPEVVHFTSHNAPILYLGRHITTIHDLTLLDYKNVRGSTAVYNLKQTAYRLGIWCLSKFSRTVLVPTEFSRQQIIKRYHRQPDKVVVTYEAAESVLSAPEPVEQAAGRYIFYLGNSYPYKNLARLVEAFGLVKHQVTDLQLVCAGPDDVFMNPIRQQIQELGLAGSVHILGRVSDGQLATLYQGATLFVFPSLSEGFGLPGLEAMAVGTPVIAANNGCLPEVYAEAAEYFDPYSANDMAEKMMALLHNPARLAEMKKLGPERVKEFSWRKMAEETLAVYKKALL